jgi:hypothetical protein
MSREAVRWARSVTVGNATAKAVLVDLAERVPNPDKVKPEERTRCWASAAQIGRSIEREERAVREALKILVERGFLERERRFDKRTGWRIGDGYKLSFRPADKIAALAERLPAKIAGRVGRLPDGIAPPTGRNGGGYKKPSSEPSIKDEPSNRKEPSSSGAAADLKETRGEGELLNGNLITRVAGLLKKTNPSWSSARVRDELQPLVDAYGRTIVSEACAHLHASVAGGEQVRKPLKLLVAICDRLKREPPPSPAQRDAKPMWGGVDLGDGQWLSRWG